MIRIAGKRVAGIRVAVIRVAELRDTVDFPLAGNDCKSFPHLSIIVRRA